MRRSASIKIIILFVLFNSCVKLLNGQTVKQKYGVLIGGLGGTEQHREKFQKFLYQTRELFINKFNIAKNNIIILAGTPAAEDSIIKDISRAENINAVFSQLSNKVTNNDEVVIVLFGHGSFDGKNSMLNIPRQDLKDIDYRNLIAFLKASRIIFVNTASCSGPFTEVLSGPNRIIITATRSGRERNETVFPKFFIAALNDQAADMDKNGDLSWLEIFQYASQATSNWFKDSGYLATEHALLEDSGDNIASRMEQLVEGKDGDLAKTTYFKRGSDLLIARTEDQQTRNLLLEREEVENQINRIISEKDKYKEDQYFTNLEQLFIRLAILNDSLEQNKDTFNRE
jgi:hypothetical protein